MSSIQQQIALAAKGTRLLNVAGSHLQSFVLFSLRVTWGWQLAESGYGHLTHIEKTVEAFKSWGVPLPLFNVYVSGSMELIGGTLLILGLATRLVAMPLIFNFLVAYATASRATLVQLFAGPGRLEGYDAFINDSAFPMLILALAMLAFGAGRVSLDALIKNRLAARGIVPATTAAADAPTGRFASLLV